MDVGAVIMKGKGKGKSKSKGKGKGYKEVKEKDLKEENQEKERTTMERVSSRSRQMCVGIVVRVDTIKRIVGKRLVKMVKVVRAVKAFSLEWGSQKEWVSQKVGA